jgi:hypothetical protein
VGLIEGVTIGWSNFARKRHRPGTGNSYFSRGRSWFYADKQEDDFFFTNLIENYWDRRYPGQGETTLERKVVVPVPPNYFYCPTVLITEEMRKAWISPIKASVVRRSPGEDLYIGETIRPWVARLQGIKIRPEKAKFANIVLYSKEALEENGGERSTDCNWEIVCLIASPVEKEPMPPLTMARNELVKPGGTKSTYSAQEYAESIYYWSQRARLR